MPELPNIESAVQAAIDAGTLLPATEAYDCLATTIRFSGLGSPAPMIALAAACARTGDETAQANCIHSLGDIALDRSDHDTARARYDEALPLFRRVGNVVGEGNCALNVGRVAKAEGDRAAAQARYLAALALYERVQARQQIAIAHEDLADVTQGGERDAHVRAAQAIWRAIGLPEQAEALARRFR